MILSVWNLFFVIYNFEQSGLLVALRSHFCMVDVFMQAETPTARVVASW